MIAMLLRPLRGRSRSSVFPAVFDRRLIAETPAGVKYVAETPVGVKSNETRFEGPGFTPKALCPRAQRCRMCRNATPGYPGNASHNHPNAECVASRFNGRNPFGVETTSIAHPG